MKVLEVLVAELVGADEGSNLGITNVVELAHEAGGSQGEETLDSARERGHGLVMCGVGDVLQDANVCPLLFCQLSPKPRGRVEVTEDRNHRNCCVTLQIESAIIAHKLRFL